ncbi:hypothetical protein LX36DRAFT_753767 [Colletotrichum falcatum]|nr:hypothetical protein LX36DRAFT_753767 [Colletotrichum falcatum]
MSLAWINRIPSRKEDGLHLCQQAWPAIRTNPYTADQYANLATHLRQVPEDICYRPDFYLPDTVKNLPQIIERLITSHWETCSGIHRELVKDRHSEEQGRAASATVCLAASLCATTRIRSSPAAGVTPAAPVLWEGEVTIREALRDWFAARPLQGNPRSFSINPRLTMSLLCSDYGYRVDWTDYLNEHLVVNTHTRVVSVYQHKVWLSAHLQSPGHCVLPQEVVGEALDTLNLLFPHSDEPTKSYLDRHGQPFYKLGLCGRERDLDLRSYRHWGGQIQELLQVLSGPRSGFRQLLPGKDQPNLVESVNFWIAVFVAGLTVISFVFGLVSVVYAKWSFDVGRESLDVSRESLELTRLQYLLSVKQACLNSEEAKLLPEFCVAE